MFEFSKCQGLAKCAIKEQSKIINTVSITCFSLPMLHLVIREVILQKQMKIFQSIVQYRPESFQQSEFSQQTRETQGEEEEKHKCLEALGKVAEIKRSA